MEFIKHLGYVHKEEYHDAIDNLIDNKTLKIDETNLVVKGESNSQYIPFIIDRYYDGVDLTTKIIQIHYLNVEAQGDYSQAINVEYNDEKIRFGWLVPPEACLKGGDLKVSVEIMGQNSSDETYIWKSFVYYMRVEVALDTAEGIIYPGDEWYNLFLNEIDKFRSMLVAATDKDLEYGAEIKAARVDDRGITHQTLNDRFESDIYRMYNKKLHSLVETNKDNVVQVWIGTNEEYNALKVKDELTEYHIIDDDYTPFEIIEVDDIGNTTFDASVINKNNFNTFIVKLIHYNDDYEYLMNKSFEQTIEIYTNIYNEDDEGRVNRYYFKNDNKVVEIKYEEYNDITTILTYDNVMNKAYTANTAKKSELSEQAESIKTTDGITIVNEGTTNAYADIKETGLGLYSVTLESLTAPNLRRYQILVDYHNPNVNYECYAGGIDNLYITPNKRANIGSPYILGLYNTRASSSYTYTDYAIVGCRQLIKYS